MTKDLRVSLYAEAKGVTKQTMDNIEEQEDKKLYHEWVEQQTNKAAEVEKQDSQASLDEKEKLFSEIQAIFNQAQAPLNSNTSYFQVFLQQKEQIQSAH